MTLSTLLPLFTRHPGVKAIAKCLKQGTSPVTLAGLRGSAPALMLAAAGSAVASGKAEEAGRTFLIILRDEEEAGYFYNDLVQMVGDKSALFFPSSYRRSVKYAQRDAANEILRTDVFTRLGQPHHETLYVVTYPAAMAERVASRQEMDDVTLRVVTGQEYDMMQLCRRMEEMGMRRKDYVYEPGEYALRGSIVDVFSFSSEYPYRIDFFGDEVDSIRSFEVQTQLSREVLSDISIVPNIEHNARSASPLVPVTDVLPKDTVLVTRDLAYVIDCIQVIYDDGFARQAIAEREAEEHATSEMEIL